MRLKYVGVVSILFLGFTVALFGRSMTDHTVQAVDYQRSITFEGTDRTFNVHAPETRSSHPPRPLYVILNETGTSSTSMATLTGFDAIADEQNIIVVHAAYAGLFWDDGRVETGIPPLTEPVNDIGYLEELVATLRSDYKVGPVYLVGFRDSGRMAYRVACESPGTFDGVAVVGTLMWDYHAALCPETSEPVDLLIIHSDNDWEYTVDGRFQGSIFNQRDRFGVMSAINTRNYWLDRLGCEVTQTERLADGILFYNNTCTDQHRLAYYRVQAGGDGWFKNRGRPLDRLGVDAGEIIVSFFSDSPDWVEKATQPEPPDEYTRSYIHYVPDNYDPSVPTPVMFMLHLRPGNGSSFSILTGMNDIADEEGFIVIYPNAYENAWNYTTDATLDRDPNYDDTEFLKAIIEELALDYTIDRSRLYVAGMSSGGFMTLRLACEASDTFAAFASVGATNFLGLEDLCVGQRPVPVLMMHGTDDPDIAWDGEQGLSEMGITTIYSSVIDSVEFWLNHNDCDAEPDLVTLKEQGNSPDTYVQILDFYRCREESDLKLYAIIGGGHTWPGTRNLTLESLYGKTNLDIDASQIIWDFVSQYSLS